MDTRALFEHLRKFDTPTICNALEIVRAKRFTNGFTRQRLLASFPALPSIVGYARTAMFRSSVPFDSAARRQKLLAYYENLAQPKQPSIAAVQDIDSQPGLGAFWGEVNTTVHWGLGCVGAVTNGSMRDLDAMHPQFQCLAATLSPSHASGRWSRSARPWTFRTSVRRSIVHADRHGAVVFLSDD
jgi:regulator of RNase E activity RraA